MCFTVIVTATILQYPTTTTTWSRIIPEDLTGPKLIKNFPAFYGT